MKRWRCTLCGEVFRGKRPEICGKCGARGDQIVEIKSYREIKQERRLQGD